MRRPTKVAGSQDVNDTNNLSISFALLLPSEPDAVADFLAGAAFALGGKEADLARSLGVSRATLSSWKARGMIPATHLRWFSEEFSIEVLSRISPAPGDDFRHAGLPAALHLVRITNFNPFGLVGLSDIDLIEVLASHMGGLVRLAQFVQHRLHMEDPVEELELRVAHAMKAIVMAAAPRVFPGQAVSQ